MIMRMSKSHTCPGEKKCKICKQVVGSRHKCFIQPFELAERNGCKFIFFDFECDQSQNGVHVPYYCVAHRVCTNCGNCKEEREFIFEGEGTLENFVCGYLKSVIKDTPQFAINLPTMTGNLF